MIEELSDLYGDAERDQVFDSILKKLFAVMTDRAAVNKAFHSKLNQHRNEHFGEEVDIQFLNCNAHFLLGLSTSCESKLKVLEKEIENEVGHRLGRDSSSKFAHFKSNSESATARYIRTACDVLGPRGDQKNGCKESWDAFCSETLNIKSYVTSFRMNRFNNFFEGAAGLYYHQKHISE